MNYKKDVTGKSGSLDAKNGRGYAMNFRQDVEGKYARRYAELVENGGVETSEILIKLENMYGGIKHSGGPSHLRLVSQMSNYIYM